MKALLFVLAMFGSAASAQQQASSLGRIVLGGPILQKDSRFQIPATSHKVTILGQDDAPVKILAPALYFFDEDWFGKLSSSGSLFVHGNQISECIDAASNGHNVLISAEIDPVGAEVDAVTYRVFFKDSFGDPVAATVLLLTKVLGAEATFSEIGRRNFFSRNIYAPYESFHSRGEGYLYVSRVVFGDGTVWKADEKRVLSEQGITGEPTFHEGRVVERACNFDFIVKE